MSTTATPTWYERDGIRHDMKNGRSGIAEAMQTSPADETGKPEVINWRGTIGQLEVCMGKVGGRFSVLRDKPLNVRMEGAGQKGGVSVMKSQQAGEKYRNGTTNRSNPALHYLMWTDFQVDVIASQQQYPIVCNLNTLVGTWGAKRVAVNSAGSGGKVLTIFRGNASGGYVFEDIDAPWGAREYLVYCNAGKGKSRARGLNGSYFARGIGQFVLRSTENSFFMPEIDNGDSLLVEDITAYNCGDNGSSAISIAGWCDDITVRDLNVDTHWNTSALAIRFDRKQAELAPGNPKSAPIIGRGKLLDLAGTALAHGNITIDLEASFIQTGTDIGGQQNKSSRPAIQVDSAETLWVASSTSTVVQAGGGNRSLELEGSGNGDIRTASGTTIGTRAILDVHTTGDFVGWGPMRRNGKPIHSDQFMSSRG